MIVERPGNICPVRNLPVSLSLFTYLQFYLLGKKKFKAFGIKYFWRILPRISDYVYYTGNTLSDSDYIIPSKISLKHDELTYMNWNNEDKQFAQ